MVKQRLKNEKKSLISDKRPSFFKIIHAGHTTDHLRIPPHFMKHISEQLTHSAILKVPSGHWHIKLEQNINGVYLKNGWQEFMNDNSLGDNEFLVFRYNGNMCFDVKIFDKSGCERIDAPVARTRQGSDLSTGKRKPGRPRKYSLGTLRLHQLKSCHMSPDQRLPCFNPKGIQRKIKTEETELANSEGKELSVWKTVESFASQFPHFKICMKHYIVNKTFILSIPRAFSQMHLPQRKLFKIILLNSEGKSWVVNTVPNASNSHSFCGGWHEFVRDNRLKQGDDCIFEFVDKKQMQVHIFRGS